MPGIPNFLVIMSDQHNPRLMGTAGNSVIRTPNLDRLAARGVQFDHAYCGSPLCVPSRMTFLTGQHCSDVDVWSLGCCLGSEEPTFLHSLTAADYETVLCGRMHFVGPDQRHGFESRIIGDVHARLDHIPLETTGQSKSAVVYTSDHADMGQANTGCGGSPISTKAPSACR